MGTLVEKIEVEVSLLEVDVNIVTSVALKSMELNNIQVEDLVRHPLPCALLAVGGIDLSLLTLKLGDIVGPKVKGFISPGAC